MTADTPPKPDVEWEPISEGIELAIKMPGWKGSVVYKLPMASVNELMLDMEEAHFLARGLEKVECKTEDIEPGDWIRVMGNSYKVLNTLKQLHGVYVEQVTQFEYNEYTAITCEILLPEDTTVSVFRPVE